MPIAIRCAVKSIYLSLFALLMAIAADCNALTILLLTENNGSLTSEESARRNYFQNTGHTVTTLWDASSQAAYDAALATADVAYVSEEANSADVGYKLRMTPVGVVSEVPQLDDALGFSTADGAEFSTSQIDIVDPAYGSGPLTIFFGSRPAIYLQGTLAVGFHKIAQLSNGQPALGFIEAGSPLANSYNGNSLAAGRRIRLPWGGDAFAFGSLNFYGYEVLRSSVDWAGEKPLILHWKLDEGAGTSAADSSNYGRTGTMSGGSWTNAVRHRGVSMAGAGRVSVANLLGNQNYFSLTGWVKINSHDVGGTDVISIGDRVVLRATGTTISGMFHNGTAFATVSHNVALADTGWRHLAFTFDRAADSMKLYVDGALVASKVETTAAVYTGGGASTVVGAHGNAGADFDLNGAVDDVRIYNKPLTDAEVRELYGLMAHYRLDEVAGTVAADSSGNGYDAAIAGAPGLGKTGVYSTAFGFSDAGTTDRLSLPHAVANKLTSTSVSFWIKSSKTGEQSILGGANSSSDNEWRMHFENDTEFKTYFHDNDRSWTIPTVADGKWQHFVLVSVAETNTTTLYRNGVSQGSRSTSAGGSPFNIAAGGLIVGQDQDSVGGGFQSGQRLIGDLDELRIYNRALQPEEIAELYGSVGHWKFDEGAGLAIADSSPAGRHASVSNGSPAWVAGMRSNALDFNGTADEAVTDNKFKPPSTGTVAFWFKHDAAVTGRQRPFGLGGDWEAWQDPDGIIRFDLCADDSFETLTSLAEIDRWYHIAAVFDAATDAFAIYVDGQLHHSGVSTKNLVAQTAARLSFGASTGSNQRFAGALDDFRVYNRKLSAAEIYEIYGLLAWYKLDETSGTVAADSTGLGNDGTYIGNPVLGVESNGSSAMGTAVEFTGDNSVQIDGMFGNPANASVAAWIRLDAPDSGGAEVISLGDHFLLRVLSGGTGVRGSYYDGSNWVDHSTSTPIGVKWHHVAAAFTQSGSISVYLDGLEVLSAPAGSIVYAGLGQNSAIATHANGSTTFDFAGAIDDVRVYDRSLGPAEAYRLYHGGRPGGVRILKWVEVR